MNKMLKIIMGSLALMLLAIPGSAILSDHLTSTADISTMALDDNCKEAEIALSAATEAASSIEPSIESVLLADKVSSSSYSDMMVADYLPEIEIPYVWVDTGYKYLQLKPGQSEEFTVTVMNRDEEDFEARPRVITSLWGEEVLEPEWITITPGSVEIKPEGKQEFTVNVSIPADAETGYYDTILTFSDLEEKVIRMYPYPEYSVSFELSVNVWTPPNVSLMTRSIYDRVEAGNGYDYLIRVKNIADIDIPLAPHLIPEERSYYMDDFMALAENQIAIDAPDVLKAGEEVELKLHIDVPGGADGSYYGTLDLGIDDPTVREWDGRVSIDLGVWEQPEDPFTTTFISRTEGAPMRIDITTTTYGSAWRVSSSENLPYFDLSLEKDGDMIEPELSGTSYTASVNLDRSPVLYRGGIMMDDMMDEMAVAEEDFAGNGNMDFTPRVYQEGYRVYTESYIIPSQIGKWELSILGHNAESFEYSITVGPVGK